MGGQVLPGIQQQGGVHAAKPVRIGLGKGGKLQCPHGLHQQVFRLVALDAHQPLAGAQVQRGRGQQVVQRGKWRAGVPGLRWGLGGQAQQPVQGSGAEVIHRLHIGSALNQGLDQWQVAHEGGGHQRGEVHGQAVLQAVLLALAQDVFELLLPVGGKVLARDAVGLGADALVVAKTRQLGQRPGQRGQVVDDGHVQQGLAVLLAGDAFFEHLAQQLAGAGLVPHRPGHRGLFQDAALNGFGLLLLALQCQPPGFFLPVFPAGLGGLHLHRCPGLGQPQQPEQRVAGVRLHQVQVAHGPCQRHIQGVDVELVGVQRFVRFVAGAAVVQLVGQQVLGAHAFGDVGKGAAVLGHHAVQDDVVVLQPLGLVYRKQQRRAKAGAGGGLVFFAQHQHRKPGGLAGLLVQLGGAGGLVGQQVDFARLGAHGLHQVVAFAVDGAKPLLLDFEQLVGQPRHVLAIAEVGPQHPQRLALGQGRVLPEQGFDLCP